MDGDQIRKLRTRAGLSQRELARRTLISQPRIASYESGKTVPSEETLEKIRRGCRIRPSEALALHRGAALQVLTDAGFANIRVFGSVARGTDTTDSDLDLLATSPARMGIFGWVRTCNQLEDLLGVPVDVVSDSSASSSRLLARARGEAVPL
ncbi:MAG: XRE family transcriptional regulator [Propionibacteriaceae bacterium]|jgi:predicted nucleotidyltransferase|nr:XRE family transcriptional regulator [Propionibacteriaceae bacterium]